MVSKVAVTYTASSLEDIANMFDEHAKEDLAMAKGQNTIRAAEKCEARAFTMEHAAAILRNTKLEMVVFVAVVCGDAFTTVVGIATTLAGAQKMVRDATDPENGEAVYVEWDSKTPAAWIHQEPEIAEGYDGGYDESTNPSNGWRKPEPALPSIWLYRVGGSGGEVIGSVEQHNIEETP